MAKATKKDEILQEMKNQGVFTVNSILIAVGGTSKLYVKAIAKKNAKILTPGVNGKENVYKIGNSKKKAMGSKNSIKAREILIPDHTKRDFDISLDKHRMVYYLKARRAEMFYYSPRQPFYHYVGEDQWVYWDTDSKRLINTGLSIIGTKSEDLDEWEKKYKSLRQK